jgi:hypothetical protein
MILMQCGSGSAFDPHSIGFLDPDPHSECGSGFRMRIRIQNADPDPGGVKSANTEEKTEPKRQKIHHKKS